MTLTDPREALADQSNFIGYLVGLAGLAEWFTRWPPTATAQPTRRRDADDFVHVLLGLASLGAAIERLANPTAGTAESGRRPAPRATRWLR